jgi:hypothetical protein
MTEVEHSVVSWRDLPTVPLICDKIIQVAMKSAPGTNVYTGVIYNLLFFFYVIVHVDVCM